MLEESRDRVCSSSNPQLPFETEIVESFMYSARSSAWTYKLKHCTTEKIGLYKSYYWPAIVVLELLRVVVE